MTTMGGLAQEREVHEALRVAGPVAATAVAGGAGDDTEVTGAEVDRLPQESGDQPARFDSCIVAAFLQADLDEDETATLSFDVEHADISGGPFASLDAELQPPDLVLTGGPGGSTEQGSLEHGIRLSPLKRFIRVKTTVDLSRADTDVASYGAGLVLAGSDRGPVT